MRCRAAGLRTEALPSNFVSARLDEAEIALENPGIWGMSDYGIDPQRRVTGVILTQIPPFADESRRASIGQVGAQRIQRVAKLREESDGDQTTNPPIGPRYGSSIGSCSFGRNNPDARICSRRGGRSAASTKSMR